MLRYTGADTLAKIQQAAENLDMFEYVPGAQDADDVGRHMILESGHFEVDPNLEDYIDYESYGLDHIRCGEGEFSPFGYVGYTGDDRLFFGMEHHQQMGGMSKRFPIALPADCSEMDYALSQTGAETWSDALCICTDCQVPQLIDAITQVNNIAIANRFAEMLDRLPVEDVSKLKAVLDATHCTDLTSASLIAGELDNYMLSEDIRDPEDMGRWMLGYMLSDADRDLILKHINLTPTGKRFWNRSPPA